MAKAKVRAEVLFKTKPKVKRKGIHSKNAARKKAYVGQGRKR